MTEADAPPRVLILNARDTGGGAAKAAMRLGAALRRNGVDVTARVQRKASGAPWVAGPASRMESLASAGRSRLEVGLKRLQTGGGAGHRSLNLLPTRLSPRINRSDRDVVNMHWVGNAFLSLGDIARIRKPMVWTLHDMWAFCGAEHYAPEDDGARWRVGYVRDNRPPRLRGIDLDAAAWRRKRALWRPRPVVTPTRWLARCVKESALMSRWPVSVVPNAVDLEVFQPWPKDVSRRMLGLPQDRLLIGFGAMGGAQDPRKGFDLLQPALKSLGETLPGVEAVVFGQDRPERVPDIGMPSHWTGHLTDEIVLALLYSAVDLMVTPSRQDNLPQSATEAQSCGCPVVAFDVGGLSDAVDHGRTGLIVPAFQVPALARALHDLLADPGRRGAYSVAARTRAEALWAEPVVAAAYVEAFRDAIARAGR